MNTRFRQTHGDRWVWTPQRVLDARLSVVHVVITYCQPHDRYGEDLW